MVQEKTEGSWWPWVAFGAGGLLSSFAWEAWAFLTEACKAQGSSSHRTRLSDGHPYHRFLSPTLSFASSSWSSWDWQDWLWFLPCQEDTATTSRSCRWPPSHNDGYLPIACRWTCEFLWHHWRMFRCCSLSLVGKLPQRTICWCLFQRMSYLKF